jgi:hypothetical protein
MSALSIYIGEIKMLPEDVSYLNELFKGVASNVEDVVKMVSRYLDKDEMQPTSCTFTLSYSIPLVHEDTSASDEDYTHTGVKVRVCYFDGTSGSLQDPPGVSYAS